MNDFPKFLYHGTSASVADKAITEGLRPRSAHKRTSNWKHSIESNPDTIYMSDAYAPYFAINASQLPKKGSKEFEEGGIEAAVIQIDVGKLDLLALVPDEDVLEQSGRGHDNVRGGMKQRTRWYRNRIWEYAGREAWLESLRAMGTMGHIGTIPPEAISKVAYWDIRKAPRFTFNNMDAIICLANYRFAGAKYKNYTNMLFGLPPIDDPLGSHEGFPLEYKLQLAAAEQALKDEIDAAKRIVEKMS